MLWAVFCFARQQLGSTSLQAIELSCPVHITCHIVCVFSRLLWDCTSDRLPLSMCLSKVFRRLLLVVAVGVGLGLVLVCRIRGTAVLPMLWTIVKPSYIYSLRQHLWVHPMHSNCLRMLWMSSSVRA